MTQNKNDDKKATNELSDGQLDRVVGGTAPTQDMTNNSSKTAQKQADNDDKYIRS